MQYIHTCTLTFTHTHALLTYAPTHTFTRTRTRTHERMYSHTCTYIYTQKRMRPHAHVSGGLLFRSERILSGRGKEYYSCTYRRRRCVYTTQYLAENTIFLLTLSRVGVGVVCATSAPRQLQALRNADPIRQVQIVERGRDDVGHTLGGPGCITALRCRSFPPSFTPQTVKFVGGVPGNSTRTPENSTI